MAVEEESGETSREAASDELRAVAGLLGAAAYRSGRRMTLTVNDLDEAIRRLSALRERLEEEAG
jgi:predicted phage tail protein